MINSSSIIKAYVRKRGSDDEWQDITAPKWFRDGKETFMKRFSEEDWFLDERKGV